MQGTLPNFQASNSKWQSQCWVTVLWKEFLRNSYHNTVTLQLEVAVAVLGHSVVARVWSELLPQHCDPPPTRLTASINQLTWSWTSSPMHNRLKKRCPASNFLPSLVHRSVLSRAQKARQFNSGIFYTIWLIVVTVYSFNYFLRLYLYKVVYWDWYFYKTAKKKRMKTPVSQRASAIITYSCTKTKQVSKRAPKSLGAITLSLRSYIPNKQVRPKEPLISLFLYDQKNSTK